MRPIELFRLRRDERWPALGVLISIVAMHWLMVSKFFCLLSEPSREVWLRFMRNFHMSGFDPITYTVIIRWHQGYDVLRHPLLAFMMWPLSMLDRLLVVITGADCVQLIAAALLGFCAFYAYIFLCRTMRFVIGAPAWAAWLLTAMFMGFAYIAVASVVPDHFCISLFLLSLTLYLAGMKMRRGEKFTTRQAISLFVLTSGVTLSNGIPVLLAILFTNGRDTFRWSFFIRAMVLPSVVMLGLAIALKVACGNAPMAEASPVEEQMKWVRQDVSRTAVVVENFFGESIQLHRKHVLGDVLSRRPVIVEYTWRVQYAVEAVLIILFVAGAFAARRERFCWLVMSVFAFNVSLHLILGFALDEVHIMAAHWAFVMPLSMAWLFVLFRRRALFLATIVAAITVYLWVYHGILIYRYLTWPLTK